MTSIDPVCGGVVERDEAERKQLVSAYEGDTFHFCSRECQRKFEASSEMYATCARDLRPPEEEGEIDRAWE